MKRQFLKASTVLGFALLALSAYAAEGGNGKDMGGMKMDSSKAMSTNEGEVKAVDKANMNVTLQHGPIKSKTVEMPAMTMSFPVQQASFLSNVKVGDKVKFNIENVGAVATVTELKVQK
jgi:Cu(I)/Ag(I) efflux system protein CusF